MREREREGKGSVRRYFLLLRRSRAPVHQSTLNLNSRQRTDLKGQKPRSFRLLFPSFSMIANQAQARFIGFTFRMRDRARERDKVKKEKERKHQPVPVMAFVAAECMTEREDEMGDCNDHSIPCGGAPSERWRLWSVVDGVRATSNDEQPATSNDADAGRGRCERRKQSLLAFSLPVSFPCACASLSCSQQICQLPHTLPMNNNCFVESCVRCPPPPPSPRLIHDDVDDDDSWNREQKQRGSQCM